MKNEKASANILVCVTKKKTYKNLAMKGEAIKKKYGNATLHMLHVTKKNVSNEVGKISEFFEVAKAHNATMAVVVGRSFIDALKDYVEKHEITHIVIGETRQKSLNKSSAYKIKKIFNDFPTLIIAPVSERTHLENLI